MGSSGSGQALGLNSNVTNHTQGEVGTDALGALFGAGVKQMFIVWSANKLPVIFVCRSSPETPSTPATGAVWGGCGDSSKRVWLKLLGLRSEFFFKVLRSLSSAECSRATRNNNVDESA